MFAHQHQVDPNSISKSINEFDLVFGTREVKPRLPLQLGFASLSRETGTPYLNVARGIDRARRAPALLSRRP